MTNKNIDVLNSVTKALIDSREGYKKAYEMTDENYSLRSEFMRRATERDELIKDFHKLVRSYGGEPETDGGLMGSVHRSIMKLSAIFRDDEKAAIDAIDDGEEYLADTIKGYLGDKELTDVQARLLLTNAHKSAKEGERFADRMEELS